VKTGGYPSIDPIQNSLLRSAPSGLRSIHVEKRCALFGQIEDQKKMLKTMSDVL
jgi:hypothetical protein